MLLLSGITDLLEERSRRGFITTLHQIRAHTHIWGNDLADAAGKMAVTQYDSLPESQKLRVTVGEAAPRPPYWFMYTVKPPPPPPQLGTDTRTATLRHPWWSIPGGGASVDARFHAPLTTSTTQSQTCAPTQPPLYLPIPAPRDLQHRGWHDHTMCGKSHAPPSYGKRLGGHNPPKFTIRSIV